MGFHNTIIKKASKINWTIYFMKDIILLILDGDYVFHENNKIKQ